MKTIEQIFNHYAEYLSDSDGEFEGYFLDKEDFIKAAKKYTSEVIKADREELYNHIHLNVDGVIQNKDYIVDKGNHYSETYIRIDKNSIINAPNIELL